MMRVWITTDTHWHQPGERIGRIDNHTQLQFTRWQGMIAREDLVIHLGDVSWDRKTIKDDLDRLPGWKVLVRGNHDGETLTWYMAHGFMFACESFVFKKVLFTHRPVSELPSNALVNVHGHLHDIAHHEYEPKPFHRLLAIEKTNYAPVGFDKFVGNLDVLNQPLAESENQL